jgi:RNA-binding protein
VKLTSRQVSFLKGLAHDKKPVILIGKNGVSDALIKETSGALLTHELIKVRLAGEEKDALDAEAEDVAQKSGAELVERRGKVATLYKRHPDEPKIALPKEPKKASTSK